MKACTVSLLASCLLWLGLSGAQAQSGPPSLPPFLTADFAPMLEIGGVRLQPAGHSQNGAVEHYAYATADKTQSLVIEMLPCSGESCRPTYDSTLANSDRQATDHKGGFRAATDSEYHAFWPGEAGETHVFLFRFPDSLQQWTYILGPDAAPTAYNYFDTLLVLANRRRYEVAAAAGDIELSRWSAQAKAYADQLLKDGHKPQALAVLKAVITAAPNDYAAQMDFARNTDDTAAARASGAAAFANAESPEMIAEGAALSGAEPRATVPFLEKGETGLQLILVPVEPSDARLLTEAVPVYQAITGIPAKVMRLEDLLYIGLPDRIPGRRQIQQLLVEKNGATDFTGWSLERYEAALKTQAASATALERFRLNAMLDRFANGGAQFEAGPILDKLAALLAPYRAGDRKTIYVGVTAADISTGDANFVFSTGIDTPAGPLNILSYNRMLAQNSGAPYAWRKRLVERIAKQLVPPSLAALGIPRPADPADPYSFADSIARVDEKTLTLSQPTRDALAKILAAEKPHAAERPRRKSKAK